MNSGFNPNNDCPICGGPAGHYVPQGCIRIALAKIEALTERVTALEADQGKLAKWEAWASDSSPAVTQSERMKEMWRKKKSAQETA